MSKILASLFTTAALGAMTLLPTATAAQSGAVKPGDTPEYTWRSPMVNAMGRSSLADLKGKLVLVEFWGTR